MWSNAGDEAKNQSHRSIRSLKKHSPPPPQQSTSVSYHKSHTSGYSDVPKRVYHHPPLTHYRSSPTTCGPSHRNISVSPVSSCDSPTLTRHFSADESNHSIRRVRLIKSSDDDPSTGITLCGGPEVGKRIMNYSFI